MNQPELEIGALSPANLFPFLYAGRTSVDVFSSQMYRFHLRMWRWELVVPSGGKAPAAAGHSMVFHAASRTLLVYGGHRPSTAR